jgi:hypothetical protein
VPRSALPLVLTLSLLLGCAPRLGSAGDQVIRIHPLQEPIDRQAGGVVEIISAAWSGGADIRPIVQAEVVEALRRAEVFRSVGGSGEMDRYLVRIEMHRRDLVTSAPSEVEGAVSVLDRQRNVVTATFRVRTTASGDDSRRAARLLGQTVAELLLEPIKRD